MIDDLDDVMPNCEHGTYGIVLTGGIIFRKKIRIFCVKCGNTTVFYVKDCSSRLVKSLSDLSTAT